MIQFRQTDSVCSPFSLSLQERRREQLVTLRSSSSSSSTSAILRVGCLLSNPFTIQMKREGSKAKEICWKRLKQVNVTWSADAEESTSLSLPLARSLARSCSPFSIVVIPRARCAASATQHRRCRRPFFFNSLLRRSCFPDTLSRSWYDAGTLRTPFLLYLPTLMIVTFFQTQNNNWASWG